MPRRPNRLTEAQKNRIVNMLRIGGTRTMAASFACCHPATIRAEMRRDPSFANQVVQSELRNERSFLKVIHAAGNDPKQWRAAAWALERLYPERYARRKANTFTEEQVHEIVSEMAEIVATELPIPKFRDRIMARFKELYTNYTAYMEAKPNVATAKEDGRRPTIQVVQDVPRENDTMGTDNEPDRSIET